MPFNNAFERLVKRAPATRGRPLNVSVRRLKTLLAMSLLCLAAPCVTQTRDSDAGLADRLVGTWTRPQDDPGPVVERLTLNADGTGIDVFFDRRSPEESKTSVSMRWSVKRSVLTYVATATSNPEAVKVGTAFSLKLVEVTQDRFVYEPYKVNSARETGHQQTWVRDKPSPTSPAEVK